MLDTGCGVVVFIQYPASNANAINSFTCNLRLDDHGNFTPSLPSPLEGEGKGGGDMPIYLLRLY